MLCRTHHLVLLLSMTFCSGLLLGILLHLPVASSPDASPIHADSLLQIRHPRSLQSVESYLPRAIDRDPQPPALSNNQVNRSAPIEHSEDLRLLSDEGLVVSDVRDTQTPRLHNHQDLDDGNGHNNNDIKYKPSLSSSSVQIKQGLGPEITNNNMAAAVDSGSVNFVNNNFQLENVVQGVYWTPETLSIVPDGYSLDSQNAWRYQLSNARVQSVTEGCGRMQNRLLTFNDGTKACARYRINNDQILGDILSFYLAMLLEIFQVPPSLLTVADPRNSTWNQVSGELAAVQWHHERPLVVVPWIDNLQPSYIPHELRGTEGIPQRLHPTADILQNRTEAELRELVQWSDLIIFDYLTANLDRVVNNMFNRQWNSEMMESPTHNLEVIPESGLLVFLDNEAGLVHSYRLLDKYAHFHEDLLKALCVFRPKTAALVKHFYATDSLGQALRELYEQREPLHHLLPWLPSRNIKVLHSRLKHVYDQIVHCEHIYGPASTR